MKTDTVAEVSIDAAGRLHVRPRLETFPHIWRAGMEVHWDEGSTTLHSPPPREWTYADWYRKIIAAAKDEYGCVLVLTSETSWVNVPAEVRHAIIAAARAVA